jgi:hypothetical protein
MHPKKPQAKRRAPYFGLSWVAIRRGRFRGAQEVTRCDATRRVFFDFRSLFCGLVVTPRHCFLSGVFLAFASFSLFSGHPVSQ